MQLGGDAFTEADRLHLIAEATKAAYYIRDNKIGDPDFAPVDVETYLSEEWAEATRRQIRLDRALPPQHWDGIEHKDTIYMCCRRSRRQRGVVHQLAVLVVRHRHHGAGKRRHSAQPRQRVPPDPRPSERDRAEETAVPHADPRHAGQGRPAVMPFGVMGGQYQAVGHATFLHYFLDRGLDPQQAAEGPRVFAYQGVLQTEHFVPEPVRADLAKRGHEIEMLEVPIGGCQAIWIDRERGVLIGGSEPRKDGMALGY